MNCLKSSGVKQAADENLLKIEGKSSNIKVVDVPESVQNVCPPAFLYLCCPTR